MAHLFKTFQIILELKIYSSSDNKPAMSLWEALKECECDADYKATVKDSICPTCNGLSEKGCRERDVAFALHGGNASIDHITSENTQNINYSQSMDEGKSSRVEYGLTHYHTIMNNPIVCSINMEHEFLSIAEEAQLEHRSLFSNARNTQILGLVLNTFNIAYDDGVVLASISSSSTLLYNSEEILGTMYLGMDTLLEDPTRAESLLHAIFSKMHQVLLPGPLVLCHAISEYINSSIDLTIETEESVEMFINKDKLEAAMEENNQQAIKLEQKNMVATYMILVELIRQAQNIENHMPVILLSCKLPSFHTIATSGPDDSSTCGRVQTSNSSKTNVSPSIPYTLRFHWIQQKGSELIGEYPHGFYIVDLSGCHCEIFFCCITGSYDFSTTTNIAREQLLLQASHDRKTILSIGKSDVMKNRQEQYVHELRCLQYKSNIITKINQYITKTILIHAMSNDIAPIVCKVFQTGLARQYHYTKTMEPMVIFNQEGEGTLDCDTLEREAEESIPEKSPVVEGNLLGL